MSGHSKWSTIKRKKGEQDAKRGNIFTKLAKAVTVAAKLGGGETEMNPSLQLAIAKARAANMPNANIKRAIEKGTGESKEGGQIENILYEGYGPAGTALLIDVITDNRNRASASLKHTLSRFGGSLGGTGSVAWMFKKRGVLCLKKAQLSDELELQLIDWGAEEIKEEDSVVEILTPFEKLNTIKLALEKKGITPENAEITYHPTTAILIKNPEEAGRMVRLMEELEEDEDVNEVYANFEIEEGLC